MNVAVQIKTLSPAMAVTLCSPCKYQTGSEASG